MFGLSGAPPHRGRIRNRLRVGPVDFVQALDVLIALIVFAADNAYLTTPQPAHTNGSLVSLFVALTTAAPLVLRDQRPLGVVPAVAGEPRRQPAGQLGQPGHLAGLQHPQHLRRAAPLVPG